MSSDSEVSTDLSRSRPHNFDDDNDENQYDAEFPGLEVFHNPPSHNQNPRPHPVESAILFHAANDGPQGLSAMSDGPPELSTLDRLRKKLGRVAKLTDNIILKRYELEHTQQTFESSRGFLQQSIEEFLNAIDSHLAAVDPAGSRKIAAELLSQARSDHQAFQTQAAHIRRLRGDITKLESRWMARSKKLIRFTQSNEISPPLLRTEAANVHEADLDRNTSSAESSEHDDTPPLLAEFYSRKGDTGVFRERLQELDYYHHEGLIEREFIADRGDELEVSDEQYFQDYHTRRQSILEDLTSAERDADALAVQCDAAGLKIGEHREDISSEGSPASGAAPVAVQLDVSHPVYIGRSLQKARSSASLRNKVRVRGWLENLPNSDPETPRPDPEEAASVETQDTKAAIPPLNQPLQKATPTRRLSESEELASIYLVPSDHP